MDDELELKDGSMWTIHDLKSLLQEVYDHYRSVVKTNDYLKNEIEKVNYLDDLIKNQDDIDSLDAVSGSTRTSNGLKNMIKKVKGDINEKG